MTNDDDPSLGHAIVVRRRQLRLRQDELADLAGVSERFVYALEHGKQSVQLDKALAVLAALGLHLELHRGGWPSFVTDLSGARPAANRSRPRCRSLRNQSCVQVVRFRPTSPVSCRREGAWERCDGR